MLDAIATRRLLLITGKGGTGKTSLTAALGLALASRGKKVLLLEVDSARPALEGYFSRPASFQPQPVAPRLDIANIDFSNALHAYLADVIPVERVVSMILKNRVVKYFLQATPGARELVVLSRIQTLMAHGHYDHIVVDLPASGHAVSLFGTLDTIRRLFPVGPLRARGEEIMATVGDPTRTGLLLLSIPEEMSVNEAVETAGNFRRLGAPPLLAVLLNRAPPPALSPQERTWLESLERESAALPSRSLRAVEALREKEDAAVRGSIARRRLAEEVGVPLLSLPLLPGGEGVEICRRLAAWLSTSGRA